MIGWIHLTLAVVSAGLFILLFFFFHHLFRHPKPPHPLAGKPLKTLFNWSDNPALITDAVENGWSRFAFTEYISSSSVRSNRFSLCAAGGDVTGGDVDDVEISWEVCQGSADFMQKIRLNSGLNKTSKTTVTSMTAASVIKSALPLPGPVLTNSTPFPQEAYFEITILSNNEGENGSDVNGKGRVISGEDENIKLIEEDGLNEKGLHVNVEELRGRSCAKEIVEGRNELVVMLSVGLSGGGSIPVKLPGSYPGSVGFNSDGSIYLDGTKIVNESDIEKWERTGKVIGCGYNPSQKKVFFTVDSKLVHEIDCKGEEFGTPLYPTLAANSDVIVLVNFGQSIFKYAPMNLQRTQNPCFVGPMTNSPSLGYEDSKELFSMGRIDSQWLNQSTTKSGPYLGNVNKGMAKDFDEASEADLFEIVIESDSYKKSPNILS
ncbi:putative ran-binding protein Vid30/RanBPM/SPLA, SPRY [Helianthus annuus]|nr:putative ran-binding protein Vid30/RanBPM/SPLA, SPRY [Helianthus annuus]